MLMNVTSKKRVFYLSLSAVILLLMLILIGCGSSEIPEGTVVTLLYTTDMRGKVEGCGCKHNGGGITKRSAKIKAVRSEDETALYCDAGNFMTGTDAVDATKGKVTVDAYNLMKASVVNVGERELACGYDAFKAASKSAKFDFISANVRHNGSLVADDYIIKKVKDARVAFIGVCGTKETMRVDSSKLPDGITIDEPVEAVRKIMPALLGKVEILVILSTCGDATDSVLAAQFPNTDVIIGGRSFRPNADAPWTIGKTRLVRLQRDGKEMGKMDMAFGADRKIKTYSSRIIAMDLADPTDNDMLTLIKKYIPSFSDTPQEGVRIADAK
jgi:2',3'-cyclic-nucleotide 2'-phosphodiesterase (5'-nucleotidase family)